jgi:hypothetical protein
VTTIEHSAALDLAARWIDALPAKDFDGLSELLAPETQLRGLVPGNVREDSGRDGFVERMRLWFGDLDRLEVLQSELEEFEGLVRFWYRVRGVDPDLGWTTFEQLGFLRSAEGRITSIDLVCSGDRPIPPPD